MGSTSRYEVAGVRIDRYDTPHYFHVEVEAADSKTAGDKALSKLRLRRGDLIRDISIKKIHE